MTRPPSVLALISTIILVVFVAAQPAQKGVTPDPTFRVQVVADLTFESDGEKQKVEGGSTFDYAWKRDGKVRTLVVESLTGKLVADGEVLLDAKTSRAGRFGTMEGRKVNMKIEDAPKEVKQMLTDSFGSPICKIEVDESGKEVKRTVVAGPGATVLIENGMIANCTMFHPGYEPDKDEWQAVMEVSTDNGVASGKAVYTKLLGGKGGQTVKVKGTLTADGVKGKDGITIKDGKYAVTGEQTYDARHKEWVAGKLTMDVSFKMTENNKDLGACKGTMVLTFEMLPDHKK